MGEEQGTHRFYGMCGLREEVLLLFVGLAVGGSSTWPCSMWMGVSVCTAGSLS